MHDLFENFPTKKEPTRASVQLCHVLWRSTDINHEQFLYNDADFPLETSPILGFRVLSVL